MEKTVMDIRKALIEVPLNSILREFIGGCCFYREED